MKITATITCDVCGAQDSYLMDPDIGLKALLKAGDAREVFKSRGWVERDDAFRDVCPAHAPVG